MAVEYSIDVCKELEARFSKAQLHRPMRVRRYDAGSELVYDVTGVSWHGLPAREDLARPVLSEVEGMAEPHVQYLYLVYLPGKTSAHKLLHNQMHPPPRVFLSPAASTCPLASFGRRKGGRGQKTRAGANCGHIISKFAACVIASDSHQPMKLRTMKPLLKLFANINRIFHRHNYLELITK